MTDIPRRIYLVSQKLSAARGYAGVSIADRLKFLLAQMVAEPMHAKLLNRIFMDNPKSAGMAARRYWRPLLRQLAGAEDPAAEATAMFCVNAIIQVAFSIELQREILGRCSAEEISRRYSQVIQQMAGVAQVIRS